MASLRSPGTANKSEAEENVDLRKLKGARHDFDPLYPR